MTTNILIGVQARSTSQRLPGKAFELIAGKCLLERVIDSCKVAGRYIEKRGPNRVTVAVLTPTGDPIASVFKPKCEIVEGSEPDVLSRYAEAVTRFEPQYIVRVTGDCPLLPPGTIEGMVNLALKYRYDYVSNVDEHYRTAIDGVDCEVVSEPLLKWVNNTATDPGDREHVTTMIRRVRPPWARMGFVCSNLDLSSMKLSVDTTEDLDRVRAVFDSGFKKWQGALQSYGPGSVHRL